MAEKSVVKSQSSVPCGANLNLDILRAVSPWRYLESLKLRSWVRGKCCWNGRRDLQWQLSSRLFFVYQPATGSFESMITSLQWRRSFRGPSHFHDGSYKKLWHWLKQPWWLIAACNGSCCLLMVLYTLSACKADMLDVCSGVSDLMVAFCFTGLD